MGRAANESMQKVDVEQSELTMEEKHAQPKIAKAQYKCYLKINRDLPYNKKEPHCNRTWDGWLCWEDMEANNVAVQKCPNYFPDFDPMEKVTKICDENGEWFQHPDTNRTWSNYTLCNAYANEKLKMAIHLYYLAVIGHSLSIISLFISLIIFINFRSLGCQRVTLHKNLFCSYVLHSSITTITLTAVANNQHFRNRDPVSCKVLQFFHQYMMGCNYFWMLCEGIYLHTLIVIAVFAEKQHLLWYYLLGWVFPIIPALIHAAARSVYYNDKCWISSETNLLYIIHGPIILALVVNLFFLLNIVRVLVTKLKDTHHAESHMYMKAVRATLILVPLLGIQFVLVPWTPENPTAARVYEYIMHILTNYQGLLVATMFCFFNGEPPATLYRTISYLLLYIKVQTVLKRHWIQYKFRFSRLRRDHYSMRSSSYSASYSDGTSYPFGKDCNGEMRSCKRVSVSELIALRCEADG